MRTNKLYHALLFCFQLWWSEWWDNQIFFSYPQRIQSEDGIRPERWEGVEFALLFLSSWNLHLLSSRILIKISVFDCASWHCENLVNTFVVKSICDYCQSQWKCIPSTEWGAARAVVGNVLAQIREMIIPSLRKLLLLDTHIFSKNHADILKNLKNQCCFLWYEPL